MTKLLLTTSKSASDLNYQSIQTNDHDMFEDKAVESVCFSVVSVGKFIEFDYYVS